MSTYSLSKTQISEDWHSLWRDSDLIDRIALPLFLLAPFIYLIDNTPPDILCVILLVLFFTRSALQNDWDWLIKPSWVWAGIAFWLWLTFTALVSEYVSNALEDGGTWIRFVVLAAAMQHWLLNDERVRRLLIAVIIAAVAFTFVWLVVEFIIEFPAERLNGPLGRQMHSEDTAGQTGRYLRLFGLVASGWLIIKAQNAAGTAAFGYFALAGLALAAVLMTGEVFNTIITFFLLAVFVLLSLILYKLDRRVLGFGGVLGVLVTTLFVINPKLVERLHHSLTERLPWRETSDYYAPWLAGLEVGKAHWLTGVGADNYANICARMLEAGQIASPVIEACNRHPHQLYIQAFAETGVVGVALLLVLIGALFVTVIRQFRTRHGGALALLMSLLLVSAFWPIAPYSHAFGQHQNLLTWFGIGLALAFTLPPRQGLAKNQ